jgi:hypothetical protein
MNPYIVAAFTTDASSKIREKKPKDGAGSAREGALLTPGIKKARLE